MWEDVIELGNQTETIVHGEPVKTIEYRSVYANKKSVGRTEHYKASALGLKPEYVFQLHSFDFDADEFVRYNSVVYKILRT